MFMMVPGEPEVELPSMSRGMQSRLRMKGAVRPMAICRSHSASMSSPFASIFRSSASCNVVGKALLIKTSSLPSKVSFTVCTASLICSRLLKSHCSTCHLPCALAHFSARDLTCSSSSVLLSRMKTRWPFARNCRNRPRPIPRAPPVIRMFNALFVFADMIDWSVLDVKCKADKAWKSC